MSSQLENIGKNDQEVEKISFRKLRWILNHNWAWLLLIILITNLGAYLYIRWTKPIYEATSEIKLDIESDASNFGIGGFVEDKNLGILSGEIELLKSRLFFQKLLDSIDLSVSYYTQGRILMEEKYPYPPFSIDYTLTNGNYIDKKVFVEFLDDKSYNYYLEGEPPSEPQMISQTVENESIRFKLNINPSNLNLQDHKFVFVINSRESLQNYIDANLNVKFLNLKANTLQISFLDYNSAKARDIVNTINELYIEYTQEERSQSNRNRIDWINGQLSKIEIDLEEFEDYFEDFTIENRTNDLDADLKETVNSINQLDSQQYELTRRIQRVAELSDELDSNKIINPSRILPVEVRDGIIQLNELRIERERLGISYKETTFTIQSKDTQIETHKEALRNLIKQYNSSLSSSLQEVKSRKIRLERTFTQIPGKSTEFNKKQRFYNLYEEFYLSLMQSKAEFEIAVAGITPNFKILEPAKVVPDPVYPNKILVQSAGVGFGFILSFLFVGVKYIVEDKFNSVEEVEEAIPYPLIGSIPRSKFTNGGNKLIAIQHPKSGVTEALRTARTNIQFFIPEKKSQVISISSSVSGEGKSFIASNLSAILAASNKKVCLLDLDMRKPSIHSSFDKENKDKGISTILINKDSIDDCILHTEMPGLDLIPAGPIPPNPAELLSNGNFENLLNQLKETYDILILDTPPIGLVTDGILAIKNSDLSLLIIRNGYTRKRDVKAALRNLRMVQSKISLIYNGYESEGSYGYTKGYYSDKSV